MDIPEKMDQLNEGLSSSLTNKRKRGRPRRDESQAQQQVNPPVTTIDENLIGQVVSGVVEGSFEAGYFLNVKVADTEKRMKGVVFLPEKVTPVTPTTDLFPQAKMYARKDIPIPSLNQQTPPQGKKNAGNQTDDIGSEPQTDKNQSAMLPNNDPVGDAGVGSVVIDEKNVPTTVTQMKDVVGSSAEEKLTVPEGQTLSLMPQFASDDAPKEDHTLLRSEACVATRETSRKQAGGSSSMLSLELFKNETKRTETDEKKSPADAEPRGLDLIVKEKTASPVDDVPEGLQLELGNKRMSASAIVTEANPDQSASSKSGFLANVFEGREEMVKEPEESNAGSESGFAEAITQVDKS